MKILLILLSAIICGCNGVVRMLPQGEPIGDGSNGTVVKLRMPGIIPKKNDDYLCTAFNVQGDESYITQFKIEGSADRAHHMLLYGCGDVPSKATGWDCGHHGVCSGSSSILFAWAKNAPPTKLPKDVGFRFGGDTQVKYLVMQIHYAHKLPPGEKDYSGMDLAITYQPQKYIAGIYLLIGGGDIPPLTPKVHTDACCTVQSPAPFYLFAYRTHAHSLGRVISGYKVSSKTGKTEMVAKGNPQWPQAFYSMPHAFEVDTGDKLTARCTYDSSNKTTVTWMGSTAGDEMCNLYLMYYTDAQAGISYQFCGSGCGDFDFPVDSDVPLPPNPLLEEHALHGSHGVQNGTITITNSMSINLEQLNYDNILVDKETTDTTVPEPQKKGHYSDYEDIHTVHRKPGAHTSAQNDYNAVTKSNDDQSEALAAAAQAHKEEKTTRQPETIKSYSDDYVMDAKWISSIESQPSAVAIDSKGNVIIFHRSDRAWGADTFSFDNRLKNPEAGPIPNATLILLDQTNSRIINQGGQNMFYVPHGLTVDSDDCLWVTDVGAHQVFKLTPLREKTATLQILLELGRKLEPGSNDGEFCKPTSVAVLPSGEFFVADGYCNSRIIKYTKSGVKLAEWGEKSGSINAFNIPHSLTVVPENDMVCVADRENGRIQCLSIIDGNLKKMIKHPEFKTYIYAIAYKNGYMFAVNGPTSSHGSETRAQGFIIDVKGSGEIVSVFGSKSSTHLGTPHSLAVGSNGSFLYIAEISPYRVTKLVRGESPASLSAPSRPSVEIPMTPKEVSLNGPSSTGVELDMSLSTSLVIISILAVPLLIIIMVVSIIRIRKYGCCSGNKPGKLDLGSLMGHRDPGRGGFEKLAMEDSDGDGEIDSDSDADVVEFTKAKTNFST